MIGCTAIVMSGIAYKNIRYLEYGLDLLKKIINSSFDINYFPKSRNIRQMVFYLKYFVLIRELLKESLNDIPEYLDEIIFFISHFIIECFKSFGNYTRTFTIFFKITG